MGRATWFLRMVSKAFRVQPGRKALSLAALAVGATLLSTFLNLYFDLPRKVTAEFRNLGANLVLAPKGNEPTISESIRTQFAADHPQWPHLPWLYAVGKVNQEDVILGGTELDRLPALSPGWKVSSGGARKGPGETLPVFRDRLRQPADPQQGWLLAGEKAAEHFGWKPGEAVRMEYGSASLVMPLIGIVATGGSEDSQLLIPLSRLQALTGRPSQLSLIQLAIPGSALQVEAVRQQLVNRWPEIEVRPLRPVIESEARVVLKVEGLMFGLTLIVLSIVLLSVVITVSGLVLDREYDIGVMKALGASDRGIALLFSAEMAFLAILAAALGYLFGWGLAQWAGHRIFHSTLAWHWETLPAVVALTLAVALLATALPVRRIRRLDPAVLLRGN